MQKFNVDSGTKRRMPNLEIYSVKSDKFSNDFLDPIPNKLPKEFPTRQYLSMWSSRSPKILAAGAEAAIIKGTVAMRKRTVHDAMANMDEDGLWWLDKLIIRKVELGGYQW